MGRRHAETLVASLRGPAAVNVLADVREFSMAGPSKYRPPSLASWDIGKNPQIADTDLTGVHALVRPAVSRAQIWE